MEKNMFNIKNKKNIQEKVYEKKTQENVYEKKIHTPENIKTLLVGYAEIPVPSWKEIPNGSHIRYIKKDGTFVRGGFVVNNIDGLIHLANNLNKQAPSYTTWYTSHNSISKIYKKGLAEGNKVDDIKIEKDRQSDIIRQMNKLTDAVKQQKTRLDSQDIEIKRLQQVVKKYLTN